MAKEYQRTVTVQSSVPSNTEPWLFDGIEDICSWFDAGSTNETAEVVRDNTTAFEGKACLKIYTGGTSPLANDETLAQRPAVIGSNRYAEFSCVFSLSTVTNNEVIQFWVTLGHSGEVWDFRIELSTVTGLVKLYDSNENYITISGLSAAISSLNWYFIRLIVNAESGKYEKLQINGTIIDLGSAQAFSQGTQVISTSNLYIYLQTTNAQAKLLYVDNVMLRSVDNV